MIAYNTAMVNAKYNAIYLITRITFLGYIPKERWALSIPCTR